MKVLYFSTVPWSWIKQRPQFIAEELSFFKEVEVEYFSIDPRLLLQRKIRKIQRVNPKCTAVDFAVLPFALRFRFIERLNSFFISKYLKKKGAHTIIVTDPRQYLFLKRLNVNFIYDCMDDIPAFYSGKFKEKKIQEEREAISNFQKIVVSSHTLKEHLLKRNEGLNPEKIVVIKNALSSQFLKASSLSSNISLKEPYVLYAGTIDKWFDEDVVVKIAKLLPSFTIYLAGPIRCQHSKLEACKNVKFLGAVPHNQIRGMCNKASLLLLPFIVNELIEAVDPVKLYEYTASGNPILSAFWKELTPFCEFEQVHFYKTHREVSLSFLHECIKAKKNTIPVSFIHDNCWAQRAKVFYSIIKSI